MLYVGYIFAILVGVSLGLIGSGGSILAVPILVYVFGVDALEATTMSLFIVGSTAFVGGITNLLSNKIHWKTIAIFGLPTLIVVYLTRNWILPKIPDVLARFNQFTLTKDMFLMVLFGLVMLVASFAMIRPINKKKTLVIDFPEPINYTLLFMMSLLIGIVTGLVGAGGGFLIVPALIYFAKLSMKRAVATSLFLIFINAYFGFFISVSDFNEINWPILSFFTFFSIFGIFVGQRIAKRVDGDKLKGGFGWFVLIMGFIIVFSELS